MNKNIGELMVLEDKDLQSLFDCLKGRRYRLLGPTAANSAIIYDEIEKADDLPRGYSDEQSGGRYRLVENGRPARFEYAVGQHSWKKYLFPSEQMLFEARRGEGGFKIQEVREKPAPMAFIGVRPCELAATAIHDKVLLEGPYQDPAYKRRREKLFLVVVNCTYPSGTCFCASLKTGPKAEAGFDLALTEVVDGDQHYYAVECGSEKAQELLKELPLKQASPVQREQAQKLLCEAAGKMGKKLETANLKEILERNFENPRWDAVAKRCLSCGNCTLVCPTCFCINVKDCTELDGQSAQRLREWDSCYTLEHSYIFGGSIRPSAKARYRQWLTHKLSSWIDQYGVSGCVGCGRCITWCPVGIDITEEAHAIRESEAKNL